MATGCKIAEMLSGYSVLLTVSELDEIESEGWNVRTAHNAGAIGTRSAPYVGWMSGRVSTSPPGLRIDRSTMRASAFAGRCVWSKTLAPLPTGYSVPMEYARPDSALASE